jgi:hypothetical protein
LCISAGSLSLNFINIFLCTLKPQVKTFFFISPLFFKNVLFFFFFFSFFYRLLHLTNLYTSHHRSHQKRERERTCMLDKRKKEKILKFYSLSLSFSPFFCICMCVCRKKAERISILPYTDIHLKSV